MKGTLLSLVIGRRQCALYLPPVYESGGRYPVVYITGTDEFSDIINILEPHFEKECVSSILVNIESDDWNNDMTPWPAPALFKKNGDFGGKADAYLNTITHEIKLYVDAQYRTKPEPENSALLGYSLGGLTSLYALFKYNVFGKIGSLSGSLWYDNWLDYMQSHQPLYPNAKVYMSLGTKEEESKNERMAAVGKCTQKAAEILKSQLSDENNLKFDWNDGGHFTEIPQRYGRALLWLMEK